MSRLRRAPGSTPWPALSWSLPSGKPGLPCPALFFRPPAGPEPSRSGVLFLHAGPLTPPSSFSQPQVPSSPPPVVPEPGLLWHLLGPFPQASSVLSTEGFTKLGSRPGPSPAGYKGGSKTPSHTDPCLTRTRQGPSVPRTLSTCWSLPLREGTREGDRCLWMDGRHGLVFSRLILRNSRFRMSQN